MTQAIHSIKTLTTHVPPEDIVVFVTPPRDPEDVAAIASLGVDLREVPELTETFSIHPFDDPGAYAEKVRCCDVESETVVFLDCDTLILGDITEVLDGEFDLKVRPNPKQPPTSQWQQLADRLNHPIHDWMPNTGFIVFKNGTHREIRDDWHRFIKADVEREFNGITLVDQRSLALAIAGYDVTAMTPQEHHIEWNERIDPTAVVHHLHTHHGISVGDAIKDPIGTLSQYAKQRLIPQLTTTVRRRSEQGLVDEIVRSPKLLAEKFR